MDAPAAFQADYVDLKFIKSRKVAQIVVEIAIEQSAAFVAAFGTPNPANGVPVALARIMPEKAASEPRKATDEPKERRKFGTLPLAQQAAMRCQEPAFHKYLEEIGFPVPINTAEDAAAYVRSLCHVESRSQIMAKEPSGERWMNINRNYEAWLRSPF